MKTRTDIGRILAEHRSSDMIELVAERPEKKKLNKALSPDFMKLGAYIPKSLHSSFVMTMKRTAGDRDLSESVEDALVQWIKEKGCEEYLKATGYSDR